MKLLEHRMKVLKRLLKRFCSIFTVCKLQFGFMSVKGTTYAMLILIRLQKECCANLRKLYMCFVAMEKFFDRIPWVMRKKITGVLVRSVMSLYEGEKTRLFVDSELKSFMLTWLCTKDLCCHLFLFAGVVDVFTELAREGVLSELMYADDLVLMSETIEGLRNNFLKWKQAFVRLM